MHLRRLRRRRRHTQPFWLLPNMVLQIELIIPTQIWQPGNFLPKMKVECQVKDKKNIVHTITRKMIIGSPQFFDAKLPMSMEMT